MKLIKMDNSNNIKQNKNRKLIRTILSVFSALMLFYSIYTYLIPHKVLIEDAELMRLTGQAIEVESEVSIVGFIFSVGFWTIIPILIRNKFFNEN